MKALLGIALLALTVTAANAQYYGGQRDDGYYGRGDRYQGNDNYNSDNNYNSSDRYDRSDDNYQPRTYDNDGYRGDGGYDRGYSGGYDRGYNEDDSYRGQGYGYRRY